jgi:hypothetical protein
MHRYSPDGEGGIEVDSLGAYVKLQDVTTSPAVAAPVQEPVQATMKLESSGPGHGPAPNQKLSVRHVSLIDAGKTPPAQPAVPDAMTSADIQEHIEYVAGWNDCRAEMLKGMK